jgi:hypothetical protein
LYAISHGVPARRTLNSLETGFDRLGNLGQTTKVRVRRKISNMASQNSGTNGGLLMPKPVIPGSAGSPKPVT